MLKYLFVFTVNLVSVGKFKEALENLMRYSQKETGCLLFEYNVYENQFFILEIWETELDFQNHQRSKNLEDFRKQIAHLLLKERDKYVL